MSYCKYPKALLRKLDLFYSNEILRYNNNSQYRTVTGGIISIIILVTTLVGFSQMIKTTFEKTSITSTLQIKKNSQPPKLSLVSGRNKFMVGLYVTDLGFNQFVDLANGPQIFFNQISISFFQLIQVRTISVDDGIPVFRFLELQQCTLQHWQNNLAVNATGLNLHQWLCLKINDSISISGSFFSPQQDALAFNLKICQNSTSKRVCASPEQIQAKFKQYNNFYLTPVFMNPIINPNQPNHIQFSINTDHFITFSDQLAVQAWILMQDYTIRTDNSILPFQDYSTEKGFIAEDKIRKNFLKIGQGRFIASVVISKSENSLIYQREFRKLSAVISYIGSLVGAVILLLFIFRLYTDSALELNICLDLFQQRQTQEESQNSKLKFNFINFISMYFYKFVKKCKIGERFVVSKKMTKFKDEINKQLDIKIILRRIIKLQDCMNYVLTSEEIKSIKQRVVTYQIAKSHRKSLTIDQNGDQNQIQSEEMRMKQKKQAQICNKDFQKYDKSLRNEIQGQNSEKILSKGLQIILNGYEGSL